MDATPVKPMQGCLLVFPHGAVRGSLLHEGSGVLDGGKFVVRTDLLYEVDRGHGKAGGGKKRGREDDLNT